MSRAPASETDERRARFGDRHAWFLWGLYTAVVVAVKYTSTPPPGDVFHLYREGGISWLTGRELFDGTGNSFNYFPTGAIPFVPFAYLPFGLGGALWRTINLAVFACGAWKLAQLPRRGALDRPARSLFPLASLIAMALSWSAARNGQMTLISAGLLMLGVVALAGERPWRAAILFAASIALKPIGLFVVGVACVLHPRVAWRFAVCALVTAALPFALQDVHYVWRHYAEVPELLRLVSEREVTQDAVFAQLFTLLHSLGLDVAPAAQTVVRVIASGLVFATAWQAKRRFDAWNAALFLVSLMVLFTLLFSPVTEQNTYAMMSPILGLFAAWSAHRGRRAELVLLVGLALLCLLNRALGKAFPGTVLGMLKPLATAVLLVYVATRVLRGRDGRRVQVP